MKHVSVVIPTYNRASSLERSVTSVLRQSRSPLEVIVVDDASTDATESLVTGLGDRRVRYLRHEANRGGSAARNTGIDAARGDWIAFQDSDDVWLPEKLELQLEALEAHAGAGVVYSGFWHVEGESRAYRPGGEQPGLSGRVHDALLRGNFVTTQSAVVRRDCFEHAGKFDTALEQFQDWELFLRLSLHCDFVFVEKPLVLAYFTPESLSDTPRTRVAALRHVIEKHRDAFHADAKLWAYYQYLLGTWSCKDGNIPDGRRHLAQALRTAPLRPRHLAAYLLSFLGSGPYRSVANLGKVDAGSATTGRGVKTGTG